MPNVFKTTVYLVNPSADITSIRAIRDELDRFEENTYLNVRFTDFEKSGDLEWHDDLAINKTDATTEDYEKYFDWPDVKTFVPGIRPVVVPPEKIIPKIIIDTRIYTDDFKTAVDDMRDYIKLGYLCNLTSIKAEYGTTDFKLEVFKR